MVQHYDNSGCAPAPQITTTGIQWYPYQWYPYVWVLPNNVQPAGGWECPKCGATYAPWWYTCTNCKPKDSE